MIWQIVDVELLNFVVKGTRDSIIYKRMNAPAKILEGLNGTEEVTVLDLNCFW